MTLHEFRGLTENEQADLAWAAVFLDVRAEGSHSVLLYAIDEFYVEVYYSPSLNKIEKLRAFKSTRPLQPYLDQLSSGEFDTLL